MMLILRLRLDADVSTDKITLSLSLCYFVDSDSDDYFIIRSIFSMPVSVSPIRHLFDMEGEDVIVLYR
jgi:hypothetical protein